MRFPAISALLSLVTVFSAPADVTSPEAVSSITIDNGVISADVDLPGKPGSYQGRRFDSSGQIRQVRLGTHTFFGSLVRPNPQAHDAIAGVAEEFDIRGPASYSEKEGEPFLKIGVGILVGDGKPYHFSRSYPFLQESEWEVQRSSDGRAVAFRQSWRLNARVDVAYEKSVRLLPNEPVVEITRTLENRGQETLITEFYSHQIICLDGLPIGPGYVVEFGISPGVESVSDESVRWTLADRVLRLNSILRKWFFVDLSGEGSADSNTYRVSHEQTRSAVHASTGASFADLDLFAEPTGLCPETFTRLTIPPDEERVWTTVYRFESPPQLGDLPSEDLRP